MLRVLTLNIGSHFEAGWDERRHEVVAWVDRLEPDICCFQEVCEGDRRANTAGWIADNTALDYELVFGGHHISPLLEANPSVLFGSAILSRWPFEAHETHLLPIAPNPEDPMPELMPWELVYGRTAGVDVFTTHLAPAPAHGRHRRVQARAIDDLIRATRGERDAFVDFPRPRAEMPAILCGDFNAEPDSDEIRFLRGRTVIDDRTTFFQDAWSVAGDGTDGFTQDWRTHPLAADLNVHRKRIDYVFVGDPFLRAGSGGRVHSAQVIADKPLTGVQASDHMGVLVEIEWPNRPDEVKVWSSEAGEA